jgi:hypothetical protein
MATKKEIKIEEELLNRLVDCLITCRNYMDDGQLSETIGGEEYKQFFKDINDADKAIEDAWNILQINRG